MKKVISISADESIIHDFTALAHQFWTNRTNLINMFMVDFIENRTLCFKRKNPITDVEFEPFTEEQYESFMKNGKDTYESICNSLKKIDENNHNKKFWKKVYT